MRVVVVGGGIAGLSAARAVSAARPEVEVIVFEQSAHVGGKLRSAELAGHIVDVGAEALLARRPEGVELLAGLGLDDERIAPLTTTAGLWVDGQLRPIPGGTFLGVPGDIDAVAQSGVLSEAALARLRAEDSEQFGPITADVSVGGLVAERLGQEVVDRLVDPLLGGVYAGRAEHISLRAAIPDLAAELARVGGSLVGAVRTVAQRARREQGDSPVFTSIAGGLGRIPQVLVERGTFLVRTSTAVQGITAAPDGFLLALGSRTDAEQLTAGAVIVATPAGKAAGLVRDLAPAAAGELSGIRTASVAIVSFAFRAGTRLPPGSGLLVPATSGRAVKGITISSQKWPGSPADPLFVRASLGRMGEEAVLQREDADLIALARRDLADLIGVRARPVGAIVTRWGGGLPQYDVGHVDRVTRLRAAVSAVPGLALAGASYDGIGIPACIGTARLAADVVLAHLAGRGQ